VFFVNVPLGVIAMVLAVRLIPPPEPHEGRLGSQIDTVGAGLLGASVLCLLLPLVESMSDPATPLWGMAALVPVLAWGFVRWERRLIARGRPPLLDVRLFGGAPGYTAGIVLASVYFCGFSGIWLVLALFFQDGLGYSPLESGLAVMPFAVGSAVSAVLAGRLVDRLGRRLTIGGLLLVVLGFGTFAVAVPLVPPARSATWGSRRCSPPGWERGRWSHGDRPHGGRRGPPGPPGSGRPPRVSRAAAPHARGGRKVQGTGTEHPDSPHPTHRGEDSLRPHTEVTVRPTGRSPW